MHKTKFKVTNLKLLLLAITEHLYRSIPLRANAFDREAIGPYMCMVHNEVETRSCELTGAVWSGATVKTLLRSHH